MAECTVVCVGCGINLTEKPKIRRNLGVDYKGYHDESHDMVVTSNNFLNHLEL